MLEKIIVFVIYTLLISAILLGVWWVFWLLWTWAIPQVWPAGPEAFVRPGYWLFVACWVLLTLIGRAMLGGRK